MSTIPEGLLEQLAAGNVLLLIGDGIVRDAVATNGRVLEKQEKQGKQGKQRKKGGKQTELNLTLILAPKPSLRHCQDLV